MTRGGATSDNKHGHCDWLRYDELQTKEPAKTAQKHHILERARLSKRPNTEQSWTAPLPGGCDLFRPLGLRNWDVRR
jgi:hypothetical protein